MAARVFGVTPERYGCNHDEAPMLCGEIIPISGDIPNVTEWHAMSDFEFDTFSGNIDVERLYGQTVTFIAARGATTSGRSAAASITVQALCTGTAARGLVTTNIA